MKITKTTVRKLIKVIDVGLVSGVGNPVPGEMCVEAAVCYALGLDHGDDPPCVSRAIRALKISLNDRPWSSAAARAKGMRKLAVLQLGTRDDFDEGLFVQKVVMFAITKTLPVTLRAGGLPVEADACAAATTLDEARAAAKSAARAAESAAWAAAWAAESAASSAALAAKSAAWAAALAAKSAAWAAKSAAESAARAVRAAAESAEARDHVLSEFAEGVANILIGMKVPGVKWLPLLETA